MEVASLFASLNLDSANFSHGLASAHGGLSRFDSLLAQTKYAVAGLFSFEAIRRGASMLVEAGSEMEGYRTRLRAVVKDKREADELFSRINRWAAINPVDTSEAIASFVQLKAAAVENAEGAVKAVADLSSVMGRDMRDVTSAIISAETEPLRNLGILVDRTGKQAIVQSGEVRLVVEKDVDSVRRAILDVITMNYAGAMERNKNTWKGITDTIGGQFKLLKQDLAGSGVGSFFGELTTKARVFSGAMDEWMSSGSYKETISTFHSMSVGAMNFAEAIGKAGVAIASNEWVVSLAKSAIALKGISLGIALAGSFWTKWALGAQLAGPLTFGIKGIAGATTIMSSAMRAASNPITGLFNGLTTLGSLVSPTALLILGLGSLVYLAHWAEKNFKGTREEIERTIETISRMPTFSGPNGGGILGSGMTADEQSAQWAKIRAQSAKDAIQYESSKMAESVQNDLAETMGRIKWEWGNKATPTAFSAPLTAAIKSITDMATTEFAKADRAISEFGLNATSVYSEVAELVKGKSSEIVKDLEKAFGPAGVAALVKEMERLVGKVPGMDALLKSFKSLYDEAKAAKQAISKLGSKISDITDPASKVAKAAARGLIPKAEAQKYLQESMAKASTLNTQISGLEFSGMSAAFRSGMAKMYDKDVMDALGYKNVMSGLRASGGFVPQPGTIGHPSTRDEVRPAPQWRGGNAWMQDIRDSERRAQSAMKQGPTYNVTINGMTISGTKGERMGTILIDGVKAGGLSIAGAAQ